MRKVVAFLSVCCVSLAIACGVLYRELEQERAARPVVAPAGLDRIAAANTPPPVIDIDDDEPDVESPLRPAPPSTAAPEEAGTARSIRQADRRSEMRAELERRRADPDWQARALVRSKADIRRQRPDLGGVLGLSSQQEEALIELLARQQLQTQELQESMRFANDSERKTLLQQGEAIVQRHQQERAELLGARYASFQDYTRQMPERQQLRNLRARLDATASLSESQTNRLVEAMYQERDSYMQQLATLPNYSGYSGGYPPIAASSDRDPQAQIRFAEVQVARTEDFQRSLRQRASQILSAEQLRRFDELQEEHMSIARLQVERAKSRAERQARRQSRPGSPAR